MMDRRLVLAGAGALAVSGPVWARPAADPFDAVLMRLARLVQEGDLPFASIRIARNGERLAEAHMSGVERLGEASLYRLFSMTKPVVAAAVMILVDEGRIALEDPVAQYVPEFASLQVVGQSLSDLQPARPMTVAHLLTHTCGLGNSWGNARTAPLYRQAGLTAAEWMYDDSIDGLAGFAAKLSAIPLEFQPGSEWLYGYGLDIAGLVIERVSGQRLGDFLQQRMFAPLGMESTGFHVPPEKAANLVGLYAGRKGVRRRTESPENSRLLTRPVADAGSAGLVSTLKDYGRFADMIAGGGAVGGVRILSEQANRTLTTPYGPQEAIAPSLARFATMGLGGAARDMGQALGGVSAVADGAVAGSRGEYAWGGAASTTFWANPENGLSVVVMTQLMPSGVVPLRDTLRPMIYRALQAV